MQKMVLGGAFRKVLHHEILLRDLQASLDASKTPEHEWAAVRDVCESLGFEHIGMRWDGIDYSADFAAGDAGRKWCFEVCLASESSSPLDHSARRSAESEAFSPFFLSLKSWRGEWNGCMQTVRRSGPGRD